MQGVLIRVYSNQNHWFLDSVYPQEYYLYREHNASEIDLFQRDPTE
jgi:hypothetical protein